jgi:hypothetical protein
MLLFAAKQRTLNVISLFPLFRGMVTTDGAYVSRAYRGRGRAGHQLIMFRVQLKSCGRVENTVGGGTQGW